MKKYLVMVEYRVTAKDMNSAIDKVENNVRLGKKHKDIEYSYIKDIKVDLPKVNRFSATSK